MRLLCLLVCTGCIDRAEELTFLDRQEAPAATGLAALVTFDLDSGVAGPAALSLESAALTAANVPGFESNAVGYAEVEGFLETLWVTASTAGEHDLTVSWEVDGEPRSASGMAWFAEPAGLGLSLEGVLPEGGYLVADTLVLHEEVEATTLQLVDDSGSALIGEAVTETGSVFSGGAVDYDGTAHHPLLDGSVLTAPARVDFSLADIAADWSLTLEPAGDTLYRMLWTSDGALAVHPWPTGVVLDDDDRFGVVLAEADGMSQEECALEFRYDPAEDIHTVTACLGAACGTASLPGRLAQDCP